MNETRTEARSHYLGKDEGVELDFAWMGLRIHLAEVYGQASDNVDESANHEAWRYEATYAVGDSETGPRWYHQFKHRDYPPLNRRLVVNVPTSATWRIWKNHITKTPVGWGYASD
jgi:hypothetical protein